MCLYETDDKDREEKDSKCVGVRNREKGLLVVLIWSGFLGMGTFFFFFPFLREIIFFFPRTPG